MGMIKEFKEFAMRGNVMDMAVGIIIGGAFGTIVKSMVDDVLMPPIGKMMGKVDFSNLKVVLEEAEDPAKEVAIRYGQFINNVIAFLIVAFCVFLLIKAMNAAKKKEEAAPPDTKECPKCFSTISIKATRCPSCTSELA